MDNKLTASQEQLIYQYFSAGANLYGIVSLRKLLKIYNSQNKEITEEQFCEIIRKVQAEDCHEYYIVGEDELYDDVPVLELIDKDVVAEYVLSLGDEDYYRLKEEQSGKPYYVPDKEKFLRYADPFYYEKTPEFLSMRAYLRNYSNLSKEKADDLAEEIVTYAVIDGEDMSGSYKEFERYKLAFKSKNAAKAFDELMFFCIKNTRMHFHRGHTPEEIF
ncbi:MAG: hypothetical protein E7558_00705 [Ruminococcaceae bacterium]|nr:hypothetical protein [Oscillospiraceae bacterium]